MIPLIREEAEGHQSILMWDGDVQKLCIHTSCVSWYWGIGNGEIAREVGWVTDVWEGLGQRRKDRIEIRRKKLGDVRTGRNNGSAKAVDGSSLCREDTL